MNFKNSVVKFDINLISSRDKHLYGEGGALNANYRQVDAVAKVAEICGRLGLKYQTDWYWETCSSDNIIISFSEEKYATMVILALDKGN